MGGWVGGWVGSEDGSVGSEDGSVGSLLPVEGTVGGWVGPGSLLMPTATASSAANTNRVPATCVT